MTKKQFQNKIFSWWQENKRDLPWRHTADPYAILVSEMMLQQTQVSRVIDKYNKFLFRFPNVFILANSSVSEVIRYWQGLGYNRRALYLHKIAQTIVGEYGGKFPSSEKQLCQLPGVGLYTARAIQVFAFHLNVAAVDTNIRQIIQHHFFDQIPQPPQVIQQFAEKLLPIGQSWSWHQALMDYGSAHNLRRVKTTPIKNSVPFIYTARFLRGRIIDLLREDSLSQDELIEKLKVNYQKSTAEIIQSLRSLEKDQLIIFRNNIVSLP